MAKIYYRIDNIMYHASEKPATIGDLVIDTKDNTFGYVEMETSKDTFAIRDGFVTEIGVPKSRVIKLVPAIDPTAVN